MQITVIEFRRRLKELKLAKEPVHLTKRGKYAGFYLSERARMAGLDAEARWRAEMSARGFTPEVMRHISVKRPTGNGDWQREEP